MEAAPRAVVDRQSTGKRARRRAAPPSDQRRRDASPEERLAQYRATGDRRLRNEVVEEHEWLAVTIARSFATGSVPLDDLAQVACVGLLKAAERFNPSFGVPYRSFAAVTIRGELRRYYRDSGWAVRVPRRLQELHYEVRAAIEVLRERLSRAPTTAEVADYLHVDSDDIVNSICASSNFRPMSIFQENSLDLLGDGTTDDPGFGTVEDVDAFQRLLDRLPEKLRAVVAMRFVEQMKQSDIARELGVSQVQISRLLRLAFALLARECSTRNDRTQSGDVAGAAS